MAVRRILALAMFPVFVAVGLVGSSAQAVAASHPTIGTYRLFEPQQSPSPSGSWVLQRNHIVAPYDAASWSITKHIVTVRSFLYVLPQATCIQYGQGPACNLNVAFTGPKTRRGIASRRVPGLYTENAGSAVMSWGLFYAVRTGSVRQGG